MGTRIKKINLAVVSCILLSIATTTLAQNNVGIGTTTPNASAMLDVSSSTQGMLAPRLTTTQRLAIVSPANGLLVYDTSIDCFFYWIQATATWQSMCANSGPAGANGINGINCWDLNGNGVDDPAEDINSDGFFNTLDCKGSVGVTGNTGTAGTNGKDCWDLNGNGINDPAEDVNSDGFFNALDCKGVAGNPGNNGSNGKDCWDLNGNGINDPAEDVNSDGFFNALDCKGVAGNPGNNGTNGKDCWDLNGNGINDPAEDINSDGFFNALDCKGATGNPGTSTTIITDNFNANGNLQIVTSVPSTITSTERAWLVGGNAGITSGTDYIGATNNADFAARTNAIERLRIMSSGNVAVNNISFFPGDVFSVYSNNTTTGSQANTAAIGSSAINGYASGSGIGIYGENSANTTGGHAVVGQSLNGSDAIAGYANGHKAFPVAGYNSNATGTGVFGTGNNSAVTVVTANGAGVSGTGDFIGIHGAAVSLSTTGNAIREGGYFVSGSDGAAVPSFSVWAHVAALTDVVQPSTVNGVTARKIEGVGTVNTTVEDINGKLVVLSCPETPENLFQDYGQGELVNGKAHITIDPTLAKNITVNDKHPLRVFIQVEGDCKGVYVSNKTGEGFDVVELNSGNSTVKFSYTLIANRADQQMGAYHLLFADERFGKAIGQLPASVRKTEIGDLKKQ